MKPREYHTAALQSDRLSGASRSHARDTRTFIFDDRVPPEIFVPLEQNARRDLTMVVRAADGSVGRRGGRPRGNPPVRSDATACDGGEHGGQDLPGALRAAARNRMWRIFDTNPASLPPL